MDLYDVDRDGGPDEWLSKIDVPVLLMGISSDWLFTSAQIRALADRLEHLGKDVTYVEVDSPNGHDSFLKDWDQFIPVIAGFLMASIATRLRRDRPRLARNARG